MTAEIAVLNFHGVALAADSAVSIGKNKVYNSANKLFALSKTHPVGVMIYGNAQTMSVPWETLIKTYRKELKNTKFDTLKEYVDEFIDYLTKTKSIGVDNEEFLLNRTVNKVIYAISNKIINEDLKKEFEANPTLTAQQIHKKLKELVKKHFTAAKVSGRFNGITDGWVKKLRIKLKPLVENAIKKGFQNIPLGKVEHTLILETCCSIFYGDYIDEYNTGIVISGFGESEIYPQLFSYSIEWRIMGFLKYQVRTEQKIGIYHTAGIVPFAQREMVDTFMEGSDRSLITTVSRLISKHFSEDTTELLEGVSTRISKRNIEVIKNNSERISQNIVSNIKSVQNEYFVQPVLDSVAALPLDELASMARTLINLTSFKRRVSLNTESVGGPIDVAVISKGDGFIWINRKHYFKPELNQHYFDNSSRS